MISSPRSLLVIDYRISIITMQQIDRTLSLTYHVSSTYTFKRNIAWWLWSFKSVTM